LTKEDLAKIFAADKKTAAAVLFFSFAVIFALVSGLFLDFVILALKRYKAPLLSASIEQDRPPGWGIWDVSKVAILFMWFGYMLTLIESFLSGVLPALKNDNFRSLVNVTVTDGLAVLFIIYFAVFRYAQRLASLGLSFKNFFRNIAYGIAGYLSSVPALLLTLIATLWVVNLFKYEPPVQPVLEMFLEEKRRGIIIYLAVLASVLGPVAEELFFRAFMYRALKSRFGFRTALFSTSALFAALHTTFVGFVPIFILGMLLAYLFEKTGTIVASCTVHIIHNTAMVAAVFIMKGILR
jgi:membrane protease YdiL (CAAX protease family)